MAELAPLYDSLRDWNLRVYWAIWARIKQFWTDERWIRITDMNGGVEWAGMNINTGQVAQVVDMDTGQPRLVPQVQNPVGELDVDIIIDDMPDHVTLQQEQFEQLAQMAQNGIPIPPEMIIQASQLQNKQEIMEALQQQRQMQMQMQMQQSQIEAQREGMKVQAQAQKDMAGAARDGAETQKTQVETAQMMRGLR
jgi:hypothetical protein